MINVVELSHLAQVIDQTKNIINTSGLSRFSKPQMNEMRNKLMELEQRFVDGILSTNPTPKHILSEINERTKQAAKEIADKRNKEETVVVVNKSGQAVVVDKNDLPFLAADLPDNNIKLDPVTTTKLESSVPSSLAAEVSDLVSKAQIEDSELRDRLAVEKKALVEKKKRKSTK